MTTQYSRTLAAAAVTATGLLLTACSSSSPSHANSPTAVGKTASPTATPAGAGGTPAGAASSAAGTGVASACALITEHEAAAALGADPGAGDESPGHCIYAAGASSMNIIVRALPDGGAGFDRLRNAEGDHAVNLPGIGDGAFGTFQGSITVVNFYKAGTLVAVELATTGTSASARDDVTGLAQKAASRV